MKNFKFLFTIILVFALTVSTIAGPSGPVSITMADKKEKSQPAYTGKDFKTYAPFGGGSGGGWPCAITTCEIGIPNEVVFSEVVVADGSVFQVPFALSTSYPINTLDLQVSFNNDTLQVWNQYLQLAEWWRFCGNTNIFTDVNYGNYRTWVLNTEGFCGRFKEFGSFSMKINKGLQPGTTLPLWVWSTYNDTIYPSSINGRVRVWGSVVFGDVNKDGNPTPTALDALHALIIASDSGGVSSDTAAWFAARVSGNRTVGSWDVELIARKAFGDISCFPVEGCTKYGWGLSEGVGVANTTPVPNGFVISLLDSMTNGDVFVTDVPANATVTVGDGIAGAQSRVTKVNPTTWKVTFITGNHPIAGGAIAAVHGNNLENVKIFGTVNNGQRFAGAPQGTLGVDDDGNVPGQFSLGQNYPNPFNPTTTISFSLPERAVVKLVIYDVLGKEVATLVNETREAGTYQASFDASAVPSGVYFYRITAGNFSDTKQLVLIR